MPILITRDVRTSRFSESSASDDTETNMLKACS